VGMTSRPPKWIKPQITRLVDEAPAPLQVPRMLLAEPPPRDGIFGSPPVWRPPGWEKPLRSLV
jgi:hypothetical protein